MPVRIWSSADNDPILPNSMFWLYAVVSIPQFYNPFGRKSQLEMRRLIQIQLSLKKEV